MMGHLLTLSGKTGRVTVRASQLGNEEYDSAIAEERSFNVVDSASARIVQQPLSQLAGEGDRVVLSVEALNPPLRYQWQFNGQDIFAATGSSLVLDLVSQQQAGSYRVVVGNSGGSVVSDVAVIGVRPRLKRVVVSGEVLLTWQSGVLQSSSDLILWTDVADARQSGYRIDASEPCRFYRLRE